MEHNQSSYVIRISLTLGTITEHKVHSEWSHDVTVIRITTTNRQVAVSIPDGVIGIFQWHNPSGRTMALGSTQPLKEMSTWCISWG
jgi:hypothetical protein